MKKVSLISAVTVAGVGAWLAIACGSDDEGAFSGTPAEAGAGGTGGVGDTDGGTGGSTSSVGGTGVGGFAGASGGSSGSAGAPSVGGSAGAPSAGGSAGAPSVGGTTGTAGAAGAPAGGTAGSGGAVGMAGAGGAATPVIPAPTAVNAHNGFLALDADNVYFTYEGTGTNGGVAMTSKASPNMICIECDVGNPRDIEVDSTHVYWADGNLGELRRWPLLGGPVETLWSGSIQTFIALDSSGIYWADGGTNSVMRADLDGSNPTVVAGSQSNVGSIAVYGGLLFWNTRSDVLVQDLSSAGPPTTLASGRNIPKGLVADATHVYWVEGDWDQPDNAIIRVLHGGGTLEQVTAPGTASVYVIALDATDVYAADNYGGTIWRVAKAGGTPEVLATGQPYPFSIAVDATHVYFTSETSGQLFVVAK